MRAKAVYYIYKNHTRRIDMPLIIVRNDITKMHVDAIVNAANPKLLGGGGVDGAIHKAAGKQLLDECKTLGGCKTGEAKITGGYALPCKYVIHTVGPVWHGGQNSEADLLSSCYRKSLALAKQYECETLAFPLISSGVYGYPKEEAFRIAVREIEAFLTSNEMTVYIVVFDKAAYKIGEAHFSEIAAYIDDRYAEVHESRRREVYKSSRLIEDTLAAAPTAVRSALSSDSAPNTLQDKLRTLDESFSEMLLRKIDEKGMTDAQCYKKANIDRKLFSKIRSDVHYKPSKPTAIAFAIALELSLPETEELLRKAGFALSHSNKFDIIIEYYIEKGIYNVLTINETLFAFDQVLLGA